MHYVKKEIEKLDSEICQLEENQSCLDLYWTLSTMTAVDSSQHARKIRYLRQCRVQWIILNSRMSSSHVSWVSVTVSC